nr:hypothetical protein CFP56_29895 [Quercus suber]
MLRQSAHPHPDLQGAPPSPVEISIESLLRLLTIRLEISLASCLHTLGWDCPHHILSVDDSSDLHSRKISSAMSTIITTVIITQGGPSVWTTLPECSSGYTTPCAPCYLDASASTFTFPSPVESITVEATPHITDYQNGSFATSWEYFTLVGSTTLAANLSNITATPTMTEAIPSVLTWITEGLTLTYPTTYLGYDDFIAAGPNTASQNGDGAVSNTCAQASQTSQLILPSTLAPSSLVVPWTSSSLPSSSLPPQILSYLDQIPVVTSQLGNYPLESCLPLPSCTIVSTTDYCSTVCPSSTLPPYPTPAFNSSLSGQPASTSTSGVVSTCTTVCPVIITETSTLVASTISTSTGTQPLESLTTASVLTTVTKGPITATNPFADSLSSSLASADATSPAISSSQFNSLSDTTPAIIPQDTNSLTHEATKSSSLSAALSTPSPQDTGSPTHEAADSSSLSDALHTSSLQDTDSPTQITTEPSLTQCTDALCGLTASSAPSAVTDSSDQAPPSNTDHTSAGAGSTTPSTQEGATGVVITLASQTVTASAVKDGSIAIGSTTISQGQAITLANSQVVSADTSAVVLGTSTVPLSQLEGDQPTSSKVVITGNGQTVTATQISSGVFAAGSTTFTAGQVVTLTDEAKTTIDSGSALVPSPTAASSTGVVITANGQTVTATQVSSGVFAAGSTTFTAGQVVTLTDGAKTTIESGSALNPGPTAASITGIVITANGQTVTATQIGSGTFVAGSSTLLAGQVVTLSSEETLTVGTGGLISGLSTVARVVFTAGSQTVTATELGSGTFVLGSATLAAGQATTLSDDEIVSVNNAGDLQLGTSTLQISTLDTQTTPAPYYVIDGQTLTPGSTIRDGSTTISLDSAGSTYFINGAPTPVHSGDLEIAGTTYPATEPQNTGLGGIIMCGLDACSTSSTDVPTSNPSAGTPLISVASGWTRPDSVRERSFMGMPYQHSITSVKSMDKFPEMAGTDVLIASLFPGSALQRLATTIEANSLPAIWVYLILLSSQLRLLTLASSCFPFDVMDVKQDDIESNADSSSSFSSGRGLIMTSALPCPFYCSCLCLRSLHPDSGFLVPRPSTSTQLIAVTADFTARQNASGTIVISSQRTSECDNLAPVSPNDTNHSDRSRHTVHERSRHGVGYRCASPGISCRYRLASLDIDPSSSRPPPTRDTM